MRPTLHRELNRNVQESLAPDGSPVAQEVLRYEYLAISRGPLAYATGLIDGFKTEESLRLPSGDSARGCRNCPRLPTRKARTSSCDRTIANRCVFTPYYRAGGRHDGAWRLTWMQLAPGSAPRRSEPAGAGQARICGARKCPAKLFLPITA